MKQQAKPETPMVAVSPEELPDYDQVKHDCLAIVKEHERMKKYRAMDQEQLVGLAHATAELAFALKFEVWISDVQHQTN